MRRPFETALWLLFKAWGFLFKALALVAAGFLGLALGAVISVAIGTLIVGNVEDAALAAVFGIPIGAVVGALGGWLLVSRWSD